RGRSADHGHHVLERYRKVRLQRRRVQLAQDHRRDQRLVVIYDGHVPDPDGVLRICRDGVDVFAILDGSEIGARSGYVRDGAAKVECGPCRQVDAAVARDIDVSDDVPQDSHAIVQGAVAHAKQLLALGGELYEMALEDVLTWHRDHITEI